MSALNREASTMAWLIAFVSAFWFFKENIGRRVTLSNLGIVLAGVILAFEGTLFPGAGGILIALACVAWGLDNNHTASIHDLDPVRCTFLKGITFGSVNLAIASLLFPSRPAVATLLVALLIGAFSYGISIVLYIYSARELGAARSQMVFASAPFFGVTVSQVYLGERIHPYQVVGAVIMVGMLIVLFKERHSHSHSHRFMEHIHRHHHGDDHHNHPHEEPDGKESTHTHRHSHEPGAHEHLHQPDIHHRHEHGS